MEVENMNMSESESEKGGGIHNDIHQIFTYGTLKRGFPNHPLMESLMSKNDAVFGGEFETVDPYPMVCGLYGIPYLINVAGSGHPVKGELYGVTTRGLTRLDDLEGLTIKHYERRPIRVKEGSGVVVVEAEAYFAHSTFGEALWKKKREIGISEYCHQHSKDYVKLEERAKNQSVVADIADFLGLEPTKHC